MKHFALIIVVLLASLTAGAQESDGDNDKKFGIGLVCGANGMYTDMPTPVFGFNFTIWNAYTDMAFWFPSHSSDTGVEQWGDEKSAFMIHFGYELKLFRHFGVIPILGYSKSTRGFTDGSDWGISSSGRIENTYNVTDQVDGFDCGAILAVRMPRWQFLVGGSRYALYTGAVYMF